MSLRAALAAASSSLLLGLASPAAAGVDVQMRTVVPGNEAASGSGRLRAEGERLRIDLAAPPSGAGATSLVFDGEQEVLRIVRHDERSYVEIDAETAMGLADQIKNARREMEAQLARMPEAQRKMIEKMLDGGTLPFPARADATKTAPLEATATGDRDTVLDRSCRIFRLSRGGSVKGDVCVADWTAVGLRPDDLAIVKKLGRFQSKMTEALAGSVPGAEQPFELLDRLDGFPLRTRRTDDGKVRSETFFEDVQRVEIDREPFDFWRGYTRKTLPSPSQR